MTQRPEVTSNGQDTVLAHTNIVAENSKILGGEGLLEKNPMEDQNSCNHHGGNLEQFWFDI